MQSLETEPLKINIEPETARLTPPSLTRLLREEVGLSPSGPLIGVAIGAVAGVGMVLGAEWVVQTAFIPNEDIRSFFLALIGTPTKVAVGLLGAGVGGVLGIGVGGSQ